MTYVITRLCSDCVDTSCAPVCPVDCIYGLTVEDPNYRRQLFIDPDECIDCSACEPECPWNAIFSDSDLPDLFREDLEINARVFQDHSKDDFTIRPEPVRGEPTGEEVAQNNAKWGYQP